MPFAATGGLGDVLGSLPSAIIEAGKGEVDVRVVLPLYRAVSDAWRAQMTKVYEGEISLAWRRQYCGIYSLVKDGVTYYFVDNKYYFDRETLYGFGDEGERFAFFSKVAATLPQLVGYYPDIVHAHDWSSALTLVYINEKYRAVEGYQNVKLVYTIHNIEYQGKYDFAILGDVFELDQSAKHIVEYDGCINLMKGAIVSADIVSTVSKRYAEEICSPEYAHGLDRILRDNAYKLTGLTEFFATTHISSREFSTVSIIIITIPQTTARSTPITPGVLRRKSMRTRRYFSARSDFPSATTCR